MIATVADVVRHERAIGSSDEAIAVLLRASRIKPPKVYYVWSVVAIRGGVMGEDASRFTRGGKRGANP